MFSNCLITELHNYNKFYTKYVLELEEKARENQERIAVLQRKISKLTKSLDDVSTISLVFQYRLSMLACYCPCIDICWFYHFH